MWKERALNVQEEPGNVVSRILRLALPRFICGSTLSEQELPALTIDSTSQSAEVAHRNAFTATFVHWSR